MHSLELKHRKLKRNTKRFYLCFHPINSDVVETAHTARNILVNMKVQVLAVLCLHYSLCFDSELTHAKMRQLETCFQERFGFIQ